jgi:diketogulonate reductase-like aldo/keto reductase
LRRGIENDLLPWCRRRKIPIMPYSPIDQGRLAKSASVKRIANRQDATASQIALAWVLRHSDVIAIPKGKNLDHVRENRGALEIRLSEEDLRELDRAFPPPSGKVPLEMI